PPQPPPQEDARVPCAHEDQGWPESDLRAPHARPQAADRLLGQVADRHGLQHLLAIPTSPSRLGGHLPPAVPPPPTGVGMNERRAESIAREHRLRSGTDYAAVKRDGRAFRGRHCLVIALPRPEEPTKIGFIASKRGVGGA